MRAQIDRRIDEYQLRPRKKFIGAKAEERFARYEEDWRAKIERVGNENYPAETRGGLYGNVRLTVSIKPDGSVESVELDRSSGYRVLDRAAVRIVELASPFAPFPSEISRDTDLLVITRTWHFMTRNNGAAVLLTIPVAAVTETERAGLTEAEQGWADAIRTKIRSNLLLPAGTPRDIEASFSIVQRPTGEILSVQMLSSSGFKPYDEATELAILKSSPLPKATAPGAFRRELILKFRSSDP